MGLASATLGQLLRRAPALSVGALMWFVPPTVLPLPSRYGPEGPPRPVGAPPRPGVAPAPTAPRLVAAQNHALLYGPFPHDGLTRGISDSTVLLDRDPAVRELAFARIR